MPPFGGIFGLIQQKNFLSEYIKERTMEPPKEFLEAIGFEEVCVEMAFPAFDCDTKNTRGYDFVLVMILLGICHFFFHRQQEMCKGGMIQLLGNMFGEAIINAAKHGNRFKNRIKVGLWVGEEGIICGIEDEGDFFKDPTVISQVESRIPIPSATDGYGMELYCELADGIRIIDNVLYLMLLKEKMITW